MCTASWLPQAGGYELFFNRDELVTRGPELPPVEEVANGIKWIAPLDGDHLGTWLGVNEWGMSFGLLNRLRPAPAGEGVDYESRGSLVRRLLGHGPDDSLDDVLAPEALVRYRPFLLIGIRPGRSPETWEWNGHAVRHEVVNDPGMMATSSGYDQPGAVAARRTLLAGARTPELMEALHRGHLPEKGPLSICMHRPEASTVSLTRVSVSDSQVRLRYTPGPPCTTPETIERTLPRSRKAA